MKKLTLLLVFFSVSLFAQDARFEKWQELAKNDINLQPEYGKSEKNPGQIKSDDEFIVEILKHYDDKKLASKKLTELGFQYLYERGDFPTAMKRFNQAYLLDPKNSDIYYGYGTIYFNLGAMSEAREQFDKGLLVDPDHSRMLTDYGTTYLGDYYSQINSSPTQAKESLEKSKKYLQQAISLDPKDSNTIYKLSIINMNLGDCDSARKFLEKAVQMKNPNVTQEYKTELNQKCGK